MTPRYVLIRNDDNANSELLLNKLISNTMESPLYRLAPELRNRIYALLLIFQEPFEIEDVASAVQPPITKVCKLFRQEGLSIFYSCNVFKVGVVRDAFSAIKWLNAIGRDNARHICKLEVLFYTDPDPAALIISASDVNLGLTKTLYAMSVCRDAVVWLQSFRQKTGQRVSDAEMVTDVWVSEELSQAGYPEEWEVPACPLCCGSQKLDRRSTAQHVSSYGERQWVLDTVWPEIEHLYPEIPISRAADFYYEHILRVPAIKSKPPSSEPGPRLMVDSITQGPNKADTGRDWVLHTIWPKIKHRYPHIALESAADFYYDNILRAPKINTAPKAPCHVQDTSERQARKRPKFRMTMTPSIGPKSDTGLPDNLRCSVCHKLGADVMRLPYCDRAICSRC